MYLNQNYHYYQIVHYHSIKSTHEYIDQVQAEQRSGAIAGFTTSLKTRPLLIAKFEEFIRNKLLTIYSKRLRSELDTFIWNNGRPEAQRGYNDDLVLSYAMGLWIRETALRLRAEGIELQKKAMSSITSNQGVYTPKNNQNDSWVMEVDKEQESLEWLIK